MRCLWLLMITMTLVHSVTGVQNEMTDKIHLWQEIIPDVFIYRDACNVYCIRSGKDALLIESGGGAVTSALSRIGVENVDWILHTHAHRDMTGGDTALAKKGAKIAVPDGTQHLFENAKKGWHDRELLNAFMYDDKYFLPLQNIPVDHVLTNGETFTWKDISLRVIATPGHTAEHISFVLERAGKKYIFCGDITCAPGKVWELDALQSSYEEFIQSKPTLVRIPELRESIAMLRAEKPDMLLPAHGNPYTECDDGLAQLDKNIGDMMTILNDITYFSSDTNTPLPPSLRAIQTCAITYLLRGSNGVSVIVDPSIISTPDGTLLKDWLMAQKDIKEIPVVIPTHFHADHLLMIPAVVEKYNAEIYSHEKLVDIYENPLNYFRPCLYPHSLPIARSFTNGESCMVGDIRLTFYHFPGQTYWHQAVLAEVDDTSILFTGDAVDDFHHIRCIDTFNYNLINKDGDAMTCLDVLEKTQPDYIATGHWGVHAWKPEYCEKMRAWVQKRNDILTKIIGQDEPNLGYDIHWTRLYPFRTVVTNQKSVKVSVIIHNHYSYESKACVSLNLPDGWKAEPLEQTISVPADGEKHVECTLYPAKDAVEMRHMIGAAVTLNSVPYGELGMACIDIGADYSIERRETKPPMNDVLNPRYGFF